MGRDQRRLRQVGYVEETAHVQVGQVDEDAQAIAGTDEMPALLAQPRTSVGRGGKPERDAFGIAVGTAPDEAQGAKPSAVAAFKVVGAQDRLRALQMQDGGDRSVCEAF